MKKILPIVITGVFLLSCSKEVAVAPEDGLREIELSPVCEVKSSFERGSLSVVWTEGDLLSVMDGVENRKFVSYATSSRAMFAGKIDASVSALTVIYPYNVSNAALSGNQLTAVLPAVQWAEAGKVSDGAILSVGRGSVSDKTISMKNVSGFVSLTLPSSLESVTKIDFSANGGEVLSGNLTVSFDGSSAPVVTAASGSPKVSLCSPFEKLPCGEYYLGVNPVTLSSGFTVAFHRSDGKVAELKSTKSNVVLRNEVLDLGLIDSSKLLWKDETVPQVKTLELNFSTWPFDEYGGTKAFPDKDLMYVSSDGNPYLIEGCCYYSSSQLQLSSARGSLALPVIPGYRLAEVEYISSEECPSIYFTDSEGNPVSGRNFQISANDVLYRIQGNKASDMVYLKVSTHSSISKLILKYEVVDSSIPVVTSIGTFNGSACSFNFMGGKASDFVCGVSYLPSGSDDWTQAQNITGVIVSSTSSSASFVAAIPGGANKARAWVRPASCDASANVYSKLYYHSSARKILLLDFSKGVLFQQYGSAGGDGTLENPRTGVAFPTDKQRVTDQSTGATSNGGGSLYGTRSGTTKYWTNYPISKFNYTQDGSTYQFLMGTGVILYDAYLYRSSDGLLINNKAKFSYPGIEGFRLRSVVIKASASGSFLYNFGYGSSYSNIGETSATVSGTYTDLVIGFPRSFEAGTGVNSSSNNSFMVKTITIEYVKE